MKRLFVLVFLILFISIYAISQEPTAWINEFHYDNAGGDVGEFVEVVIENPCSYTLSDFVLYLYNGDTRVTYDQQPLDLFSIGNIEGNFVFYIWEPSSIQNGAQDGLALVYQGAVIAGQFLSYEGTLTPTNGPANGMTSVDVGVTEVGSTPVGFSLQLSGNGFGYNDFTWEEPAAETKGSLNNNQLFINYISATPISSVQIDLNWLIDGYNGNVMVAFSIDGIFGIPIDGISYNVNDNIIGGGTIIYNGSGTSYNHINLSPGTRYFYKSWLVDGSNNYSYDLTDAAATYSDNSNLIISEVANPESPYGNAKFVEIFNKGATTIHFSTDKWYFSRQANGNPNPLSWADERLDCSKSIASGESYLIAYTGSGVGYFESVYGLEPDQESKVPSGSGNDSYMLYYNGDHINGTLIDIYGEIDVNGDEEYWEYDNSKATRKRHITTPNNIWNALEWVIIPAAASEMTPGWHDKDLIWNGGSTYWNTASNWTDGGSNSTYPPDAGCDIIIPNLANDPVISGRASTNNMEIEPNAVVTINPTNFLVTGSEIDNQAGVGGLIVQSDINSHDGMLLLGSGTTQATIERYLTDDKSHFISAPTTNATADDLYQNDNPKVYLYEHHEWDNSYNYLVPTTTEMTEGKGFSTWVDDVSTPPSDHIIAEFDGILMSSDLALSISTTPAMSYTYIAPPNDTLGYNLLGNPYPVPLNWRKGSWISNNIEQTVWIWEPYVNSQPNKPDGRWLYKPASGTTGNFNGIIPSGQAFFVKATGSDPSITIPANARTVYYPETTYYKSREIVNDSSEQTADYVKIDVSNQQDIEDIYISFNEYGTEDFDNGWDASKLRNSYSTVCLYILKESRDQCIEHLPTLYPDEERIVEIGFETTIDGEHTLAIDMTYLPNTNVTLEDLKYNQTQDMKYDSVYSFVAFTDDNPNRFRIHFNKTTTGIEFQEFDPKAVQSVQIYSHDKNIYIKKEDVNSSGYVMVYDLYGREVLTQPLEHTSLMKIPVHLNNTYLIVKVISDNKVVTSKVYIR